MCELFGMSAKFPSTIRLSLDELALHGGATGPHRDGWGVAFMQSGDALVVREPEAASESHWLSFMRQHDPRSGTVIAHIRRATRGERLLRNTQPFQRELGGRVHVFAHNGTLSFDDEEFRFPAIQFRPVGDTDSELAFCALLERMRLAWKEGIPSLAERIAIIEPFAADLRTLGQANFLYADNDALFAHGHRRKNAVGVVEAPGLYTLCRTCNAETDGVVPPIAGLSMAHHAEQVVALVASVPLSNERWQPVAEGELVVLREGRIVHRSVP